METESEMRIDYIQGDKFIGVADFAFAPVPKHRDDYGNLVNTFDISKLKDNNIIYTHLFYVKRLFEEIRGINTSLFTIVSHNGDNRMDNTYFIPDNVMHWWTQNVDIMNERVFSIPIGLPNDRWVHSIENRRKMEHTLGTSRNYRNLLYLNYSLNTNSDKRVLPHLLFKDKPWVTYRKGLRYEEYIDDVYNHKFVICPEGNGMDTHRTWETLYMGSIPIEKWNYNNRFYTDLPICFVNDWEEINVAFLDKEYDRIKSATWNLQKLTFDYWKDKIQGNG